ncbi:hypothetical protein FISHEDRAFT_44384 [Fistulina hepatica ATCC 64428]|uniref:RRM domain-containing protein n=1 Tax=Fistulina hepatica ATCC 64428 TaxID=1128425 RepID=A0A0D7ABW7_9AGAR|nr:hypothetical protein FISHEDRAFT_44384 [Fistulina hepatica ATCC 64428]
MDVKEEDIEVHIPSPLKSLIAYTLWPQELFRKTVGPLKESFIVYNSHGKSKGMAVVHFFRPTDAAVAREKYNGKVVDGKRPIKIEIMSDEPPAEQSSIQRQSLFSRIQGAAIPAPATYVAGPRRLNKRVIPYKKTAAELDKEMDDYRAAIDD